LFKAELATVSFDAAKAGKLLRDFRDCAKSAARSSHGVAPPESPLTEVLRKRVCVVLDVVHDPQRT
jgi:hypothetical protein